MDEILWYPGVWWNRKTFGYAFEVHINTILKILPRQREQIFPNHLGPRNGKSGIYFGPLWGEWGCSWKHWKPHPPIVSLLLCSMYGRKEHNLMVHFLQNKNLESHFVISYLQLVWILWKDSGGPKKVIKIIWDTSKLQSGILKFIGVVAQEIAIPKLNWVSQWIPLAMQMLLWYSPEGEQPSMT